MTALQIIFLISASVILVSAVMVTVTRNLVHAALWLIAALFGVAAIFAVLEAGFLAVVQVVVYIGAIAIMFIFAVMLTRREMLDKGSQMNKRAWLAGILGVLLFASMVYMLSTWVGFNQLPSLVGDTDTLALLGNSLLLPSAYLLPFEVASVLLLAALVGAVYVASNRK
jgi:NADH:ubiquinone oxidoreductase subunit 6 (subunit J)